MVDTTWNRLNLMMQRGDLNAENRGNLLLSTGLDVLGMELASLTCIEDECLNFVFSTHKKWHNSQFHLRQSLCQFTIEHGDLIASHDLSTTNWDEFGIIPPLQFAAYIGMPIVIKNHLYGTIFFASKQPRKYEFTEREEAFLQMIAGSFRVIIQQDFLV